MVVGFKFHGLMDLFFLERESCPCAEYPNPGTHLSNRGGSNIKGPGDQARSHGTVRNGIDDENWKF